MEERLRHYIGNLCPISIQLKDLEKQNPKPYIFSYDKFKGKRFPLDQTTYFHDLTRFIHPYSELHSSTFLLYPHDRVEPFDIPIFVKSRPISNPGSSILLNMNYSRHFKTVFDVNESDIPFEEKKNMVIWRGGCTGYGFGNSIPVRPISRQTLVETYFDSPSQNLDIGLSQFDRKKYSEFIPFEKPSLTLKEQLQHKFILSVEGNDVATNLKWILYSNSIPVCPSFFIQSWILEDQLIPYVHYLPVHNDFSDLEEKVEWALGHPEVCKQIVSNGKKYITPFLDVCSEEKIRYKMLKQYSEKVKFV